jgi:two-component system sensor histidine kinase TctE
MLSAAITYYLAESYATDIYDDQLRNTADSVVGRLRVQPSGIEVDLTPAARAVLVHNFKDRFYFQVISDSGKLIYGDEDLPEPQRLTEQSLPQFGTSKVKGDLVRTLLILAPVEEAPHHHVFVHVAETLHARRGLTHHILITTAVSQLVVVLFGAFAVWYGVARGLAQLDLLKNAVACRSQSDLSPLAEDEAPSEVRPLVRSINDLMLRLRQDLEAQQRFVANAAHQLRTPLAGLKTYIGLLQKLVVNENAKEVIKQLDTGADRTTHLVNRLLALAKAEPNAGRQSDHRPLDLNFVASEATASLVAEAVDKNIELSFDGSEAPALILGDTQSLQELVINVVENAVLYTQCGGTVAVTVKDEATVQLIVEDNGPGIPEEERERVFERFYRILGTGISGSGLGLSIVSEIARSHNARVLLERGSNCCGTKVVIQFLKAGELGARKESTFR